MKEIEKLHQKITALETRCRDLEGEKKVITNMLISSSTHKINKALVVRDYFQRAYFALLNFFLQL